MLRALILITAAVITIASSAAAPPRWSLVIHGGAGVIERARLTPEQDIAIRAALALALGGSGGVIVIAPSGEAGWSFNTPGMYRAKVSANRKAVVAIYGDE